MTCEELQSSANPNAAFCKSSISFYRAALNAGNAGGLRCRASTPLCSPPAALARTRKNIRGAHRRAARDWLGVVLDPAGKRPPCNW